jgi:hypothetical protein
MSYNTDIERLNYYEGEFLGAADFQAEQEYHREMRRRHNLGQHTWGIVTGLDLIQAPSGNANSNGTIVDVFLQPGMAVDGFGREIVLLNQVQLTSAMFAAYYNSSPSASPILVYVWIAYEESLLQPAADACTSMNVSNAYSRTQETYTLTVTATSTAPPNAAVVVDGRPMAVPAMPASSSGAVTILDPPTIALPYDDSVPFQEFSTDDSTLNWWLPLGRVSWDPYNGVLLQIVTNDPVNSAISAAYGREYAGNVSAMTYAPAGLYAVMDRNSAFPLLTNDAGVQMEVAGSLQVDRDLDVGGNAATTGSLAVGGTVADADLLSAGCLSVYGNRTYLLGADAGANHWIMAGGQTEGSNNAICLNYDSATNKGQVSLGSNWNLSAVSKAGYVVDRFVSAAAEKLERGDVVVIRVDATGPLLGGSNRIPLIEVERTRTAHDARVCGIVDEPNARSAALQDLDQDEAGKSIIGLMVILGSYAICKVDADIAPISAGDLLTTSPTAGHAQKLDPSAAMQPGIVIAKALSSLNKGRGSIPVLVSHQ